MVRLLIALILVCATTSTAHAQSLRRPALHWSRGARASTCIDPHALALRVTALTGPVLVDPTEAEVSIEGHIDRLANGSFEARFTATGNDGKPRGERTLQQSAGDCRALDAALAFVVAVLIDPDLALERLPPALVALGAEGPPADETLLHELEETPPKPVVLPKAERMPVPVASAAMQPAPPVKRHLPWELQAGPALGVREFPRLGLGAWLSAGLLPVSWLALELQLRALFMLKPISLQERSVHAESFAGALLVCPRYAFTSALFLEGCAGPDLSLFRARGHDFWHNRSAYLVGAGANLGLGLGLRIKQGWLLRLRGNARILINEPHFDSQRGDSSETVLAPARVGFGVNLGVGYRF
jgi:hypothetical protein